MNDPTELLIDASALDQVGQRRTVLIVEDDRAVRLLLRRIFEDAYDVHEAVDGEEGLIRALDLLPTVVIADQRMPGMTGVELLSRLRTELPRAVRVLVSGYSDYGPVVDAVNAASVHTYFEKPFHRDDIRTVVDALVRSADLQAQRDIVLDRLEQAVRILQESNRQLQQKETILEHTVDERTEALLVANRQLKESNRRLEHLAVRDSLTGLFNHRSLMEHLELEVARSARYKRTFCLLFVDLDDFKQVNDRLGHRAGDDVLRQISAMLGNGPQGMRRSDFGARYGGEEFCVILPETAPEGGLLRAQRLCTAIRELDWRTVNEKIEQPVTVSVGVASFPRHGDTPDQILQAADEALYSAKKLGKDRAVSARDPLDRPS